MILVIESQNEHVLRLMAALAEAFQAQVRLEEVSEVSDEERERRMEIGAHFRAGLKGQQAYKPTKDEWYQQ